MDEILKKFNQSIEDVTSLKKKVKKKLKEYEQAQKEAKKPTREEQDDGWITVHNKDGRDQTKKRRKAKKRKTEKLLNFYAFEVKESKLRKHKELLEKFEADKKRLAKMREQRKFKL